MTSITTFPSAHRSYNLRAQEMTDDFVKEAKGAGIDPAMLKKDHKHAILPID